MEYLSKDDVLHNGIEFSGDVCFSGEYGQQVCTKETEDGKIPIKGNMAKKGYYKYGLALRMQKYDEKGNITEEKQELNEYEKRLYEKYVKWYEGKE